MNKLRKQKTKKLFYGKWPYKIATVCPGGSYIRAFGVEYCKVKAEHNGFQGTSFRQIDNQKLVDFCIKYKTIPKEIFKVRFEGSHVNFFVENKTNFLKIIDIMKPFVTLISEPEDQEILETLQSDKKIVVVDNFPFGKYTSRIIFKTMPLSSRENLHNLLKKYDQNKIRMTKSTEKYFTGEKMYMQDPYMYIEDEKMLTLLALAANGYIKKTEKFVLKSSINTCLEQEQTCQPSVKA